MRDGRRQEADKHGRTQREREAKHVQTQKRERERERERPSMARHKRKRERGGEMKGGERQRKGEGRMRSVDRVVRSGEGEWSGYVTTYALSCCGCG
jgi:hypothetical protein